MLPWAECPINNNRTGPIEECEKATSTQYFFYRETLNISPSIEENGPIHQGQALCFLLAWMMTYLFVVKGVKSTGKVRELQVPRSENIYHSKWEWDYTYCTLSSLAWHMQLTTHAKYIYISRCSHIMGLENWLSILVFKIKILFISLGKNTKKDVIETLLSIIMHYA